MFNFCIMLQSIFMKLHTIIWNTRGYVLVKLCIIWWEFTHVTEKSLRVSFFWYIVYMILHALVSAYILPQPFYEFGLKITPILLYTNPTVTLTEKWLKLWITAWQKTIELSVCISSVCYCIWKQNIHKLVADM